jgi:hypothetical protein
MRVVLEQNIRAAVDKDSFEPERGSNNYSLDTNFARWFECAIQKISDWYIGGWTAVRIR